MNTDMHVTGKNQPFPGTFKKHFVRCSIDPLAPANQNHIQLAKVSQQLLSMLIIMESSLFKIDSIKTQDLLPQN